jgi:tetratricopeptide (TPR) repeat protein
LYRAAALNPNDAWTLANRGLSHVWKEQFDDAAKDLDAAAAIQSAKPGSLSGSRAYAHDEGQYSEAVIAYSTALEIEPSLFALGRRAQVHWGAGNAAARSPTSAEAAEAVSGLGRPLRAPGQDISQAGQKQEALAEADALIAANPKESSAFFAAANIYGNLGATEREMQTYDRRSP